MDESRLSAIKARVSAATSGPWEVTEIRDGRQPEGVEELGVFAPNDPRSYQKPDETWHSALICRGMDGPTRAANAAFIAHAREDVEDLAIELQRAVENGATLAMLTRQHGREREHMEAHIAALEAEVERLTAALDAARCEAAEGMRKQAARLCRTVATVDPRSDVPAQYAEAWRRAAERCEIMILESALPIDALPGAS